MESNRMRAPGAAPTTPGSAPATPGSAPEPGVGPEESFLINLAALAAGIASIGWIAGDNRLQRLAEVIEYPAIVPCAVVFASVAAGQMLRRWRRGRELTELAPRPLRALDWRRPLLRLLALAATLAIVGAAYAIFPEYQGDFYAPFWKFLRTIAYAAPLIPLYLAWSDRRLREPRDELLEFGLLLTGQTRAVNYALIRRHFMGWTVKGFFTPLMTVYLSQEMQYLCSAFRNATGDSWQNYDLWFHLSYGIDLLFCVVGYTATLRLFDSQIRSVEPTALGWGAALICYQPFYAIVGSMYLKYESGYYWGQWLGDWPHVRDLWGVVIILCVFTYALSTVAFGLRFSNLTHRGIITTGPYRFSKHPAYLAKNLSWWLIAVPFVPSPSIAAAAQHCALLLLLNGVYLLRARTEERHLSRDPQYVAYALWMNEHGALKGLARWLPVLKYRAPPD
jgi:protein-S-isoprenylcysteine O-methyltransferase Ste14